MEKTEEMQRRGDLKGREDGMSSRGIVFGVRMLWKWDDEL